MFSIEVDSETKLALTMPYMAEEIFELVDRNREHLSKWMGWLDATKEPKDTREFIESCLKDLSKENLILCSIVYKGRIVGNIDLHSIERKNKKASIGYWLDKEANGKGIMNKCVKRVCEYAFSKLGLEKIVIECDVENYKSCAVAKRAGFIKEAMLKRHLVVNEQSRDFNIYALFKE